MNGVWRRLRRDPRFWLTVLLVELGAVAAIEAAALGQGVWLV